MYDQHKRWFDNIKNDPEYKKKQNELAKARYHIRKAKNIEKFKKLEKFELAEKEKNVDSLAIIENQKIVTNSGIADSY